MEEVILECPDILATVYYNLKLLTISDCLFTCIMHNLLSNIFYDENYYTAYTFLRKQFAWKNVLLKMMNSYRSQKKQYDILNQ